MPIPFPTQTTLCDVFGRSSPFSRPKPKWTPSSLCRTPFPAWSADEDVKNKAGQLSEGAVKEFEKASASVQAKTGQIELYSAKYYAACTLGGIFACVSRLLHCVLKLDIEQLLGSDPYCRHTPRPRQMSSPGRLKDVQREFRGLGKDRPS